MRTSASIVVLFALAATGAAQDATTLYVASNGRTGWSGRLAMPNEQGTDGPLPSLEEARDAVRRMRLSGTHDPVKISIRGGTFTLERPLVLTPQDSDVNYESYPGETAVISGGREIGDWTKTSGNLWAARVSLRFRQLFVGGRRAQRARTPNFGFYRIDGPSSQDKPFRLRYRGEDIRKSWANAGVEVIALLAWAEVRMPIVSVDEEAHSALLAGNPRPSNRETDARYWMENAPDGLDAAGEWRLDDSSGTVYYWPLRGENLAKTEVVAPLLHQLIRIEGQPENGKYVSDVTFRGLDFRYTDWSVGPEGYADTQAAIGAESAIEAIGAERVGIEHCRFSRMGGYAVWFGRGSRNNRILANEILDMGAGGIKIGETVMRERPDEQNLVNVISDNHIHHLGIVYPAAVGIWVGQSSRNTISHNHIHDLYYTAISVGWTWGYTPNQCKGNRIEYNHLHDIGQNMLSDMGAIYTLGEQPGTVVRNNLIHDVSSFTYGGWGIYPDEGSSEELIENNIVYQTKSAGFHQHYGRENVVRNNVFAFGREFQIMRTRAEPHISFTFEKNIVYFDQGGLLGSNWTGDGFRMDHNIYWNAANKSFPFSGLTWEEWRGTGHDADSRVADPMFFNAGSYDFRLRPESPALKTGFQPIDMSGVGPRTVPGP